MRHFLLALTLAAGGLAWAQTAPAPLQSWNLENCRAGGAAVSSIRAGQTHSCDLNIVSVRAGAAPSSAVFRYELEYQEGGQTRRIRIESADTWRSGAGGSIRFVQRGNRMTFTLPINVRRREDRQYTAITVSAELTFPDGSRRRVYDTLPVR